MKTEIKWTDLDRFIPKFRRAIDEATDLLAQEIWGNIMEFAPQDTGRLAGSFKLEKNRDFEYIISSNVEYAAAQNWGTDPYMIYPRRKKALRFQINGEWIFAKEVLHPGLNPTYYIEGSIAAAEKRIREFVILGLKSEGLI